ncbi:TPA: viroplasmin family protein [Pseudomonas aeruginosa]|uniref:ribonuclease H1 domain-containing protein n=1 Tax=Pseudomonas aeruginosa TaxID=287 RepID=UPI000F86E90A|nr:viroplasmin family protein [Pseudomonas aeruginosa]MDV6784001.1 ribonuclease H [Pseudomonas aeruginosa]RUJ23896.1 ribonuclease H [Pseudomonas aeruginosa]HBO5740675.1 GIY-YIG nuclease family protein [Pseudomonas aeruginosa]HEK3107839.1 viroplasmin family protein [Pseudomonas aeruginosa]HEK3157790.1 viroplasmin family protein [Pseudomonas aeruginosa]
MAKKPKFYAVVHGRKLGIFNSWEGGARLSIDRFPEAKHQSFATLELAEEWYRQNTPTPGSNHSPVLHFNTQASAQQTTVTPQQPQQPPLDGVVAKDYVVYLIIDPVTEEPFYVGQTGDFEGRQRGHLRKANHDCKRAAAKIAQILDDGMTPAFKVVETCESKEASLEAETRWIEHCTARGITVWNRTREHRQIQALHMKPRVELDQIIGDGPFTLGPYQYDSRFELKSKLNAFLAKSSQGAIQLRMATEKLRLIWKLTRQAGEVSEFRIVKDESKHQLEAVLVSGSTVDFDYAAAIDRLP